MEWSELTGITEGPGSSALAPLALAAARATVWQLIAIAGLAVVCWAVVRLSRRVVAGRIRARLERLGCKEATSAPAQLLRYRFAIVVDAAGFSVTSVRRDNAQNAEPVGMRWADIDSVIAFKRDLFAVDCLCLFLVGTDGKGCQVDEEMAGWDALVEALPRGLPGCQAHSEWFLAVAFPAFATNRTLLYSRAGSETDSSAS